MRNIWVSCHHHAALSHFNIVIMIQDSCLRFRLCPASQNQNLSTSFIATTPLNFPAKHLRVTCQASSSEKSPSLLKLGCFFLKTREIITNQTARRITALRSEPTDGVSVGSGGSQLNSLCGCRLNKSPSGSCGRTAASCADYTSPR